MSALPEGIIGTYELQPGINISISAEEAQEYASMRAVQLSALAHVVNSEDFGLWSDTIQSNTRWLLSMLANELACLIPIVHADAC